MPYAPTRTSVTSHSLPAWFDDAKLGIFIHWGPYSVPGWAPKPGKLDDVIRRRGWSYWLANNPYVEWYINSLKIPGSPTQSYHAQTYGANTPYDVFTEQFRREVAGWSAEPWADLFQRAGARYVVQVTKHHDGFLMWPSRYPNPHKTGWFSSRDLVGELAAAVRARGLRMGLYYSGGLDWTFEGRPIRDLADMLLAIPQSADYAAYADHHWRELIERYQPAVMWNDIGYPARANLWALFADYYNAVPDGVINDRFTQADLSRLVARSGPGSRLALAMLRRLLPVLLRLVSSPGAPMSLHADFRTPEYTSYRRIAVKKWEATRGLGNSFGYNRNETDADLISVPDLIRLFVDIVSKNGNLLLNVGPMADGTIPEMQQARLLGLGEWLAINGEAIYGTRPWVRAEGRANQDVGVRFTQKAGALYAIALGKPQGNRLTLRGLRAEPAASVVWLRGDRAIPWRQAGNDLALDLPGDLDDGPAHAFRILPAASSV